jgi:hypothetical protein
MIQSTVSRHIEQGYPRDNLTTHVENIREQLTLNYLPIDWVNRQILLGLEQVYDELITTVDSLPISEALE